MKKLLHIIPLVIIGFLAVAQAPKLMNYQGVARDADGKTLMQQEIGIRISLISSENIDRPVYAETHQVRTNSFGLFNIKVGGGESLNGSMETVEWGRSDHFIAVEVDVDMTGDYVMTGLSQLLSVPYAFYAERSGIAETTADDSGRDIPFTGTNGQTIRHDGSVWTASSTLFNDGTNVGIGTTTPAQMLDVAGDMNIALNSKIRIGNRPVVSTVGTENVFIGDFAGNAITTGSSNAFIGYKAGEINSTGHSNAFIGFKAGEKNTTGFSNAFIGQQAGRANTEGKTNVMIGRRAGFISATGDDNVFIGHLAGEGNYNGSSNTYIGSGANGDSSLTFATAIGANATVSQSNSIVLGSGEFVGIGTPSPSYELDVVGTTNTMSFRTQSFEYPTGAVDGYLMQTDGSGYASWTNPESAMGWQRSSNTHIYNTGDSVGINTSDPLAPLHIMGSTTMATMMLTPSEPFSGDDAQIVLTEDDDNTYNMTMKYDGGDNRLYFTGKNNASENGPHMGINRDNGRVGIGTGTSNPASELEVVGTITATAFDAGDASGLANVYADSLRGSMQADTNDILQWNGAFWDKVAYGKYAFHASASTDQTIGDTSYDTLRCNNSSSGENFEFPAGVYDNSTYAFEAPVDGIYFFEAAVLWDNANLSECRNAIFIRVNNTDEVGEWAASGGTDFFGTGVSTTLELNAGDEVRVRVYNGDSTGSMDTFSQSGKYCYFSGYMVFAE